MQRRMQIGLALKIETAGNRMLIEKNLVLISELNAINGDKAKINETAKLVAETLATEFKLFKEIGTEPSCDLTQLVANHMRIIRTFEVKKLT
jgi:hypothetical protein